MVRRVTFATDSNLVINGLTTNLTDGSVDSRFGEATVLKTDALGLSQYGLVVQIEHFRDEAFQRGILAQYASLFDEERSPIDRCVDICAACEHADTVDLRLHTGTQQMRHAFFVVARDHIITIETG